MRKIDVSQIHIANAAYLPLYANALGYSAAGPNERDEPFVHFYQFDVSANQLLKAMPALVDPDADFLWRATMATLVDHGGPGDCRITFQDPWLNLIESDLVIFSGINGNNQPSPRHPEVLIPGNGVFYVTIQEYTGGESSVYLSCFGVKRFKC